MKNIAIMSALAALLMVSACSITQEMKEGVSFEGLKTFYVDSPGGTWQFFSSRSECASVDAELKSAISEFLTSRGYERVDEKSKAQIIFRPLWNVSMRTNEDEGSLPLSVVNSQINTIGFDNGNIYATLEIQAILPDGDLWAWRGFSPMQMSTKCFTVGAIKDQVRWCLEYFPPDEYPSKLEEIKREKTVEKSKREQNPFNEVLIKERQEAEKKAK